MASPQYDRPAAAIMTTSDAGSTEQETSVKSRNTPKFGILNPGRQILMAWTCLLLTVALFLLTTLFAINSTILKHVQAVSAPISRPISILRLLSGVFDVLLLASCSAAFERLQWMLVSRRKGISAAIFLSLSKNTGLVGLVVLAFGSGGTAKTTRTFAALRLLAIVLCPALGIIIMSTSYNL
jgi:hypothetical protein